jgi:hypothetical protein
LIRSLSVPALALVALFVAGTGRASATLANDYLFSTTTGTYTPLSGGTLLIGGTTANTAGSFNDSAVAGPVDIGFNFVFNCVSYTQFTTNAEGMIILGTTTSPSHDDDLTAAPAYPVIAAWWQHAHTYDGGGAGAGCTMTPYIGVAYGVSGTAPNRVLTIDWHTQVADITGALWWAGCGSPMNNFQMRLYETSNVIEFQYGSMWASSGQPESGSIGVAAATTDYMSVTPVGGTSATASSVANNNNVQPDITPITSGTIYRFAPCYFQPAGLTGPSNGGTVSMVPGDSLLANATQPYGNPGTYLPFNLTLPAGSCASRNYSMTITGTNATDYTFQASGTQTLSGTLAAGASVAEYVVFTTSGIGIRPAMMTLNDVTNGCSRTYMLMGEGSPRIILTGIPAQGGTATMTSGDTLMAGKLVTIGYPQNFTPFTASNINTGSLPAADVTYTITGGNGQYTINPGSASIAAGGSNTPAITFNPFYTSAGPQSATLTVTADGESHDFILYATAVPVLANFFANQTPLDSTSSFYTNTTGCIGVQPLTVPIDIENPGSVPVMISGVEVYKMDTTFSQGTPSYPLSRTPNGKVIPFTDYIVTTTPAVAPIPANPAVNYPITINPGNIARIYLTFISQRVNKRFARIFIRTDAVNFGAADTGGVYRPGLLRMDLYGRGAGGRLSSDAGGGLPRTVPFAVTKIGDSVDAPLVLYNSGQCDLRIALSSLTITAGDVEEFSIVRVPQTHVDNVNHDIVLPPGVSDSVICRFKPRQMGSRRAGFRLVTNDSAVIIPGITEQGVYYVDLYGNGKADLYASDVDFGMALIGGGPSEHIHRSVHLKNTINGTIVITKFVLEGPDTADIKAETNPAWPNLPLILNGGDELDLGVVFGPLAGGPLGARNATLKLITSNGDTIIAHLGGIAATRVVSVTPIVMNFGPVTAGKQIRRTVTITNTGMMSLTLAPPLLSPGSDFVVGSLPRLTLVPGQTEYLEVTYVPQTPGGSNATLTIASNATNGALQITLNGTALKTKLVDTDPSQTVAVKHGDDRDRAGMADAANTSGVAVDESVAGVRLWQSVPNPANDEVEIRYTLDRATVASLELYDAAGRMVRLVDGGDRGAGEHRVTVDVRELPSGTYHYRLIANGASITRTMTIVR